MRRGCLPAIRSEQTRFSAVVDNGVVKNLDVEEKVPNVTVSCAEETLKRV